MENIQAHLTKIAKKFQVETKIPGILLIRKGLQPGGFGMFGNTPFIFSGVGFLAIGGYALYLTLKYKKEHFDNKNDDGQNKDSQK